MEYSTTTCDFTNPVDYQGNAPDNMPDFWQFASSTCATEYSFDAPQTEQGFTWGALVANYLLFTILVVLCYQFLYNWVKGQKVRA